jgi:putative folate metabolism gamma-glutamate ligase
MRIQPIQTHPIPPTERDLFALLDRYVHDVSEGSVLAITSKIVAICEGRSRPIDGTNKRELIVEEAERYLPAHPKYGVSLTIKHDMLIATAGIDESNTDGCYVLWPSDAQRTANEVRAYLARRFALERVGVIVTDSRTTPLRIGVTGVALAHSGFRALNDYVGALDLFGRALRMTKVNVIDALATSAVLVMGEGDECTPMALLDALPFVTFQPRDPSTDELQALRVTLGDDLYAPLLTSVDWQRGRG